MDKKEFEIFLDTYTNLPRQGPGNNESTKKALENIKDLPAHPLILDLGCGSGMQTLEIARNIDCNIITIDNFPQFITELNIRAVKENLSSKITTFNKSMFELDFEPESFDILWAEGSIYIIGLEKGLIEWTQFLKNGGYFAFTECSWLTDQISPEPEQFWATNYPEMKTVSENLEIIENLGFEVINHFTLPENAWWDTYYNPLKANLEKIAQKYGPEADSVIAEIYSEINLYQNYSNEYGYEFFIIKKG
ncbi:MAG: hypothetical protein A2Y25_10010 [Candidatus Melainabacteria bacterium GWF2_37_15]|nr:MAG: hypothetical protein A2Y25_10010 [Candidatus Melainabacteria bacterium GWF2_37_15]